MIPKRTSIEAEDGSGATSSSMTDHWQSPRHNMLSKLGKVTKLQLPHQSINHGFNALVKHKKYAGKTTRFEMWLLVEQNIASERIPALMETDVMKPWNSQNSTLPAKSFGYKK